MGLAGCRRATCEDSEVAVIRFDDVTIDVDAHQLFRAGSEVAIQPQVLDVLIHLVSHRERLVTKNELLDEVWQHRFVTESAITSRIKSARQAIGDNGRDQRLIRTVHGRGYRFVGRVDEAPPVASEAAVTPREPSPPGPPPAQTSGLRLPAYPTPFVGREFELGIVVRLIEDPASRLVTILGPGGMGKTRLAVAVAERTAGSFADGACFVPLAPVSDPERIVFAIADALSLSLDAHTSPMSQLCDHLAGRQTLLILDNLEHVLPLALLTDLLDAAPGLRILATSRERVAVRAERAFELGGMGWTPAGDGTRPDDQGAFELFANSARHARADLTLDPDDEEQVRRICRLVGGMPLAIELAAGWSDVLGIRDIADEIQRGVDFLRSDLRDVPERHRSIRSVCDASWARLTPDEQRMFMKSSVFRGGFRRDAAEAVAAASLPTLRRLVAVSMISTTDDHRYSIHELLREYGERALEESGAAAETRARHSEHHLRWIAERVPELKDERQFAALGELAAEQGNIAAAWTDAVTRGDDALLEGAVEALWLFHDLQGRSGAMAPLIEQATAPFGDGHESDVDDAIDGATWGPMLLAANGVARAERGDLVQGRLFLERAADRRAHTRGRTADREAANHAALIELWSGWVDFLLARNSDAQLHGERGLDAYREIGDRWGVARCEFLLGNNLTAIGQLRAADDALTSCRSNADAIGDERIGAMVRRNLAILAGWFGDYGTARSLLAEALNTSERLGDRLGRAYALRELGKIEVAEGHTAAAVETLHASIAITDDLENRWESAMTEDDLGNALAATGDLDAARRSLRRCLEAATDADNRYYIARCTGDLGALAAQSGHRAEAKQLLDRTQASWEQFGHEPYLAWTIMQLAHLARTDTDRTRAMELYRKSLESVIREELAPFALEIAVGVVEMGLPDDPAARSDVLRGVLRLGATTAAVRRIASDLLATSAGTDAADEDGIVEDETAWRSIAETVADVLAAGG
jgi:predicted ATPase/DNA-binding winged helix-turn-helix (wHTH) protein/tetratricopeptide (TPR) repeat protein